MCHSALATFYLHVKDLLSNSLKQKGSKTKGVGAKLLTFAHTIEQ